MQDIRDYARLRTILVYAPYLSPEFDGPLVSLNKALVGVDVPNACRAVAPLVHLDAFHAAFGIKEEDPMWLAPDKRVQVW